MCPLSTLISSLARGPLMKWRVLIPLRGVASTWNRESLLGSSWEAGQSIADELPSRGPQALARRRAEALGEARGERAWRGLPVGCRTGQMGMSSGLLPLRASRA